MAYTLNFEDDRGRVLSLNNLDGSLTMAEVITLLKRQQPKYNSFDIRLGFVGFLPLTHTVEELANSVVKIAQLTTQDPNSVRAVIARMPRDPSSSSTSSSDENERIRMQHMVAIRLLKRGRKRRIKKTW